MNARFTKVGPGYYETKRGRNLTLIGACKFLEVDEVVVLFPTAIGKVPGPVDVYFFGLADDAVLWRVPDLNSGKRVFDPHLIYWWDGYEWHPEVAR